MSTVFNPVSNAVSNTLTSANSIQMNISKTELLAMLNDPKVQRDTEVFKLLLDAYQKHLAIQPETHIYPTPVPDYKFHSNPTQVTGRKLCLCIRRPLVKNQLKLIANDPTIDDHQSKTFQCHCFDDNVWKFVLPAHCKIESGPHFQQCHVWFSNGDQYCSSKGTLRSCKNDNEMNTNVAFGSTLQRVPNACDHWPLRANYSVSKWDDQDMARLAKTTPFLDQYQQCRAKDSICLENFVTTHACTIELIFDTSTQDTTPTIKIYECLPEFVLRGRYNGTSK